MGKMGRPRHPDILTPREWEVLALLRERLTNEQIASHLGITMDGAKYHVSQILAKLGVSTREEAATWRPAERRSWWTGLLPASLRWVTIGKIAGVTLLVATAIGIGMLALGVLATGGSEEDDTRQFGPALNPLAGREVYLTADDPSLLIASLDVLDQSGIMVVHSFADLQASVDTTTAAIIIDRGSALQLDRGWVRSQYEQGVVIVGIGINMSEMPSVLGLSPVGISGDFGSYPESRRFYSLISKQPCGGGAAQDFLDLHPQSQFNLLIHRMANHATVPNGGGEC